MCQTALAQTWHNVGQARIFASLELAWCRAVASIREREGQFHVQVRRVGYPARTASFSTRRLAERWATTIEAEMIEGRHFRDAQQRRRTVAEAFDDYEKNELPEKRSSAMHASALKWWRAELGTVKLANVTPKLLDKCRDKLKRSTYQRARPTGARSKFKDKAVPEYRRSPATVNRFLAVLSHVFSVERIDPNPVRAVSKLKETGGRVRYLSDDERPALLAQTAKDPTLHTFVMIALSTACRAGELSKLEWRHVDLKRGTITFHETKTDVPRTLWLHGEALRLLKAHAKLRRSDGELVFENPSNRGLYDYRKGFVAAVRAAKLKDVVFHTLRHSAATYLARAGVTERQLRAIGGWRSNAADVYVHLAAEESKSALKRLAQKVDS